MRIAPIRFSWRLIPVVLGLLLLLFGIPQTIDSAVWVMTGDSPDQLGAASPSSDGSVVHNIMLLENVDRWVGDPRARIRAGILRLRRATIETDNDSAADERRHAIADLASGLARSPGNAIGWAALADGELAIGDLAKAKAALKTSMLIDDHDPQLSLWRCGLGLALWNSLDADDRRLWNDQVRETWGTDPSGLVALARQNHGAYAAPIRLALILDPRQLAAFNRAFGGWSR